MTRTFLSLGSNLGDRVENLRSVVRSLGVSGHLSVTETSSVYETDPVEVGAGHPDYLNCVVGVECSMPPLELLRYCQGVEAALGREGKGEMVPRTIDIDILLYGGEEVDLPDLRIPHPGVRRAFNVRCLADISEQIHVPGYGNIGGIIGGVDMRGVRKYGGAEILRSGTRAE